MKKLLIIILLLIFTPLTFVWGEEENITGKSALYSSGEPTNSSFFDYYRDIFNNFFNISLGGGMRIDSSSIGPVFTGFSLGICNIVEIGLYGGRASGYFDLLIMKIPIPLNESTYVAPLVGGGFSGSDYGGYGVMIRHYYLQGYKTKPFNTLKLYYKLGISGSVMFSQYGALFTIHACLGLNLFKPRF